MLSELDERRKEKEKESKKEKLPPAHNITDKTPADRETTKNMLVKSIIAWMKALDHDLLKEFAEHYKLDCPDCRGIPYDFERYFTADDFLSWFSSTAESEKFKEYVRAENEAEKTGVPCARPDEEYDDVADVFGGVWVEDDEDEDEEEEYEYYDDDDEDEDDDEEDDEDEEEDEEI